LFSELSPPNPFAVTVNVLVYFGVSLGGDLLSVPAVRKSEVFVSIILQYIIRLPENKVDVVNKQLIRAQGYT
jgi:hypothetical protein